MGNLGKDEQKWLNQENFRWMALVEELGVPLLQSGRISVAKPGM